MKDLITSQDHSAFLADIKNQIKLSQQKAFNAVDQEMILLYFTIGAMTNSKQIKLGRGAKVIDTLSADILQEFPAMSGSSTRNLKRMVRFYKEYQDELEKVPLAVAQMENLKVQPTVAEYSLRNMSQPIGISEYQLTEVLPKEFESSLPTIEMIENELKKSLEE